MSFQSIAQPFINLGIPCFPLAARTKIPPAGLHWDKEATTDIIKVIEWNTQDPTYNVGLAALGEICFLEFDVKGGIMPAATEMKQEIPLTRTQASGRGFAHYIFVHTERSRALGNRSVNLAEACTCTGEENRPCLRQECKVYKPHHHHEWFSFRADNKYLVGAGSTHPNGNLYPTLRDVAPIPIPDWLVDWIENNSTPHKRRKLKGYVKTVDSFDFDHLMGFFDISICTVKDDVWHVPEDCMGVGHRHKGSVFTAFYWDGEYLGWNCFAQNCPLNLLSIGQVIKFLNERKGEPYLGPIWSDDSEAFIGVDYVDDNAPDGGEADVEKLDDEFEGLEVDATEVQDDYEQNPVEAQPEKVAEYLKPRKLVMPESCMYGWLGWAARELETPLGYAYPAMLTASATLIKLYPRHIRPIMYTCLIGGVHCGKSETIKRAVGYKNIQGILAMPTDAVKWTVPGSDRGLIKIFQQDKEDKTLMDSMLVPTVLLAQDELRNTFAKSGITNSALPSTFCSAWEQDEVGTADKTGTHSAEMHLNLLGALKADNSEDFADVFNKDTTSGMYDRFVFGLAPKGWEYDTWERPEQHRKPKSCTIPTYCWDMMKEWRKVDPINRGRLGEIAMRVAYITSAMNHDPEVTKEAMTCALEFCSWQEWIRTSYKAGLNDTQDGKCTAAILNVLEKLEPGTWLNWRIAAGNKNWYRTYTARVCSSTRDALAKTGMTVEETVNGKRTGRLRLRVSEDDSVKAPTKEQEEQMKGKPEPMSKYYSND